MTDIDTLRHVIGMAAPELNQDEYTEAHAALDRVIDALKGSIQHGIDDDDRVWIAPGVIGVDKVAAVLGVTETLIRQGKVPTYLTDQI